MWKKYKALNMANDENNEFHRAFQQIKDSAGWIILTVDF